MRMSLTCCAILLCCLTRNISFAQASFTAPDTVYVNDPVTATNTTAGGSAFYWNFCSGSLYNVPNSANLGNPSSLLNVPVFIVTAKEGADFYAFATNHNGHLIRYFFGNSLLNTPVGVDLNTVGGIVPNITEGLQIVQDGTGWHVIIVGGADPEGVTPQIVRIDFGATLANPSPTGISWGNIGNLQAPHDLFITKENNNWYGFTVNYLTSTLTRFDFGTDFSSTPTAVNFGNIGGLSKPTGVVATQDNGNWYIFVGNETPGSLTRLDFGNSLTNTPTGANLGNMGIKSARDLCLIRDCGKLSGLLLDAGRPEIMLMDFPSGITGPINLQPTGITDFDFLHSISTVFREGNDLYAFVVDAWSHELHRVAFNSCTNSSIPSSAQQQPPVFSYNTPGTYTINLIADEGLPTQTAYCKNIVVLPTPPVIPSVASFTAPDTVCVNTPINVTNTTTNGTTYYWNFCSGSLYNTPQLSNLGNFGGLLDRPVFMATAKEGNDYYAFITNNSTTPNLLRLYFGNSYLNTPTITNLGTLGGVMPVSTEGIQVVQDADGWHAIVVGSPNSAARIVKVDFGASLANNAPTATDWGNIGNLNYPIDLYMFQEGNRWYGLTVNFFNNTLTRFDFGTDFRNPPTGTNLGNLGVLDYPVGIFAMQEGANWHVFVTNERTSELVRLDFGGSLTNTPTAVNLGNPDGVLQGPRDLCVLRDCGKTFALVVNEFTSDLVRLDFETNLTSPLKGQSLGNGGNMDFPHSISTMFREGNSLYAFITNVNNNTVTRLVFNGCNDASIPSSTQQQPAAFSYNKAGIYTVNLLVDESLPTQSAYCKTIVVLDPPVVDLGADITVCNGGTVTMDAGAGFNSYTWNNGATTQQITVNQSGTYTVEVSNGGCTAQDDRVVTLNQLLQLTPTVTDIDCNNATGSISLQTTGGATPYSYYFNGAGPAASNSFDNLQPGTYTIRVQDQAGCELTQPVTVIADQTRMLASTATFQTPTCNGVADGAITALVQTGVPPFEYALNNGPFQTGSAFNNLAAGSYKLYTRNAVCLDSVLLTLTAPSGLNLQLTPTDELCSRQNGSVAITIAGGTPPYSVLWNSNPITNLTINNLSAGSYNLELTDANGCDTTTAVSLQNISLPPVRILNSDTTINIGETIQLAATGAADYIWTPAESLSCASCATPLAQPMQPTTYIVNTVTGLNCVKADTVNVWISFDRSLYVPNAFTPNKDGINDLFRAKGKGIAIYHMKVFNRWGQLLYETDNITDGWNGRFKSELQPMGTYVYMIQYAYFGKEKELLMQKGMFTLLP